MASGARAQLKLRKAQMIDCVPPVFQLPDQVGHVGFISPTRLSIAGVYERDPHAQPCHYSMVTVALKVLSGASLSHGRV